MYNAMYMYIYMYGKANTCTIHVRNTLKYVQNYNPQERRDVDGCAWF